MSLIYPAGGATAALGVVGLCKSIPCSTPNSSNLAYDGPLDMLFNGEGEKFNVRHTRPHLERGSLAGANLATRWDNFSNQSPRTLGQILELVCV